MILIRAVRRFGDPRPVDAITAAELRAWLLELTFARGSIVLLTDRPAPLTQMTVHVASNVPRG